MLAALVAGIAFAAVGAGAERLASVWPADEASHRGPGLRTVLLAIGAGMAGGAVTWRSTLPAWALAVHLLILAVLVVLTATDLEQRRLPHLLLDSLIVVAALFVPFNPTVAWSDALIGGVAAVAFMGVLGLMVRGGVAFGDLYLVGPIGLVLGWPAIFVAVFVAGLLSAVVSALLLVTRRAGLKTYIPFGPFLVAGMVVTLLRDPALLGGVAAALSGAPS
ncbi:MAG TPA: A24 family peptidase [Candidatus Limnocylindria bacterium]|jgi:leader peptidase (prepilin peptidase)/N-methyltransferase